MTIYNKIIISSKTYQQTFNPGFCSCPKAGPLSSGLTMIEGVNQSLNELDSRTQITFDTYFKWLIFIFILQIEVVDVNNYNIKILA